MISRTVSIATAVTWLLALLVCFAFGNPVRFDSVDALIIDLIVLTVIGVIVAAVCFACRPRRWLAALLLVISLLPAYNFARVVWLDILFFRAFDSRPLVTRLISLSEVLWTSAAILFLTLALLWAVICVRLRRTGTKT
jgi:hypothetical protein